MSLLNHTSVDDLRSTIKCSIINNRPFSMDLLEKSLDDERQRTGSRSGIIKILQAEMKRQSGSDRNPTRLHRYAGSFGGAA